MKSSLKRLALAAVGVALLATLAGCVAENRKPAASSVAQAAEGFMESAKVDGLGNVTLAVTPVKAGDNRIIVTVDHPDVSAVEAQVIMAAMGHGTVEDLTRVSPGRFEVDSRAIGMDGKWLIRVKATLPSGEQKDTLFHLTVNP